MIAAMKRMSKIGLCLVFGLALALPAYPQTNAETNDWQKVQNEKDEKKKADLLNAFIKKYDKSTHRPEADFNLVDLYLKSRENVKVLEHAEAFKSFANADNAAKSKIFSQAMVTAATINDAKKTAEFGDAALQAEPKNYVVLSFLAANNLPNPAKAAEYAVTAVGLSRPATMQEEQYEKMQVRMHGLVGEFMFAQQKFKEANEHFPIALKANPKDHVKQFRHGFALISLAALAAADAQMANNEFYKAMSAKPEDKEAAEKARARLDASSKQALEYRDAAMEALGKAVVLTGQFADQAQQLFDNAYKSKTGSLDGKDKFLADKKAELGL
jgi:hypothetical protein